MPSLKDLPQNKTNELKRKQKLAKIIRLYPYMTENEKELFPERNLELSKRRIKEYSLDYGSTIVNLSPLDGYLELSERRIKEHTLVFSSRIVNLSSLDYEEIFPEVKKEIRRQRYNERIRKWFRTPKGIQYHRLQQHLRRRRLPSNIRLNAWEPDSNLHHLTPNIVAYVPRWLNNGIRHNLQTGKGMYEINSLALAWIYKGQFVPPEYLEQIKCEYEIMKQDAESRPHNMVEF